MIGRKSSARFAMLRRVSWPSRNFDTLSRRSHTRAGKLLVQLVKAPSFENTVVWELREGLETVSLFRSASPNPDERRVLGHVRLKIDQQILESCVSSLRGLSLAVFPVMPAFGILDGTRLQVCIGVGFSAQLRVSWIQEHPPIEWLHLERLTTSMMEQFEALPIDARAPPIA